MSTEAAVLLVAELERDGVRFRLIGDKIAFHPRDRVSAEQLGRLVALKPDVMALVAAAAKGTRERRTTQCFACGGCEFWSAPRMRDWVCASCHAPELRRDQLSWLVVPQRGSSDIAPEVVCVSCLGHRFVRLKSGRRSVCWGCEEPQPDEIEGDDVGLVGGAR